MIAATQLKKPSNWQDFEKLCKLLWGEIWDCTETIKRHGRQGQNQHGVDVYAFVDKYGGYCGIQCKGKDDYTNAELTEDEIDKEIKKAKTFEPELKMLLFATTANKNAKIEGYVRKRDVENRDQGLFKIDIASWEDIVDQLERYRATYNWYVNNCQFKDSTDISVTFDGKDEVTIRPQYVRTTTHYVLKELSELELAMNKQWNRVKVPDFTAPSLLWSRPSKIDKRWCRLYLHLVNVGSTVIRTPKLKVFFKPEDIIDISDRFSYINSFGIDEAAKAQINASMDAKREVFQTYANEIEYRPKESTFLQEDERNFSISIIPAEGLTKLPLFWRFLCEDYKKEGYLMINVVPSREERQKIVEVHNEDELKPDETVIEAKIVKG